MPNPNLHFFLRVVANPFEEPAPWGTTGHFVLNPADGTSHGNVTVHASDNSWLTHFSLNSYTFDEQANTLEIEFATTAVFGTSPFPPIITNPTPLPVGVIIPTSSPNVFIEIVQGPPGQ